MISPMHDSYLVVLVSGKKRTIEATGFDDARQSADSIYGAEGWATISRTVRNSLVDQYD